jgi:hypothetical protein
MPKCKTVDGKAIKIFKIMVNSGVEVKGIYQGISNISAISTFLKQINN